MTLLIIEVAFLDLRDVLKGGGGSSAYEQANFIA